MWAGTSPRMVGVLGRRTSSPEVVSSSPVQRAKRAGPAARLSFLAARRSLGVLAGFLLVRLRGDLSAIVGPLGVVAVGVGVDADEEIEHLADGAFLADGVA